MAIEEIHKMRLELVSICIPVYNGEKYLRQCLDAVFLQTYPNYEVIITDDQSSDTSREIIEEYLKKFPKIKFIVNETNLGLVGNWNKCVELATGYWIKYVFQDDLISPDCLEKMVTAAGADAHLVACARNFLIEDNADDKLKKYFEGDYLSLNVLFPLSQPGFISAENISKTAMQYPCINFIGEPVCVMFRIDSVKEFGNFDDNLAQICDFEYWLRICSVKGLLYIPERLATFRVHGKSTTTLNLKNKKIKELFTDEIIFTAKLLYVDIYKEFRKNSSSFSLFKLKQYLKVKIAESSSFLSENKINTVGTRTELNKLNKINSFVQYSKPDLFTKILLLIVRLKRKLAL